jgi:hypothetical protein
MSRAIDEDKRRIRCAVGLRLVELHLQWLGELRADLTYGHRLRLGEVLRDVADAVNKGGKLDRCYVWEDSGTR